MKLLGLVLAIASLVTADPSQSTLLPSSSIQDVVKHETGRCAVRGHCGSEGTWDPPLPCPYNGPAVTPQGQLKKKLINLCGTEWNDKDLCCDEDQVDALRDNLEMINPLLSSCPACQKNFYTLFCTFTCSPDQSQFVNVTSTIKTSEGDGVASLDNLWDKEFGITFFESCKEVKFTGGTLADIFGSPKTYHDLLKYLGTKRLGGSPFQINFPPPADRERDGMKAINPISRPCNDAEYRCACVDCSKSCPTLPSLEEEEACYVGVLPCLSFASILVYSIFVVLVIGGLGGHIAYRRHARRQNERMRLLQDSAPSDDEDEGDVVHNAGMLDRPQRNYKINSLCDTGFSKLGGLCAKYPLITIFSTLIVVGILSLGWIRFEVETDPVRLWVSRDSAAAKEKAFFDENFGPFYRTEQVFITNSTHPGQPVLSYDTLRWWFEIESAVAQLATKDGITLQDVCLKPLGKDCVVQSVTGYWQGNVNKVKRDGWQDHIRTCVDSPLDDECRPLFQQPLNKNIVLGGVEQRDDIIDTPALVVTWVVNNYAQGSEQEGRAMAWESVAKDYLNRYVRGAAESRGLQLSFSTEISLEEELSQTSNTDAKIVVISYIAMFIYVSFALGSAGMSTKAYLKNPAMAMVHSKFTLGVAGIIIVILSVVASVGLFSAAGVKVTLIIAEVIPFLVLAIGVDNIFLIVHELERVNQSHPDEEVDVRIAKALGRMGPSILLSALTETVAFVLGVFVGMPAVKNFAIYAAGAVVINAILQVTMFVAVLALNQRRVESNRIDCFPFIRVNQISSIIRGGSDFNFEDGEGPLQRFIRKVYAPGLLNRQVKVAIITLFIGFFAAGIALLPTIPLGLDQKIAIPKGSYLIDYFTDLETYLSTGPPVYFVVRDANITERSQQQAICGRFSTCNEFSLSTVLAQEAKRSNMSYITGASAVWFDDFFLWLNPDVSDCCTEGGEVCFDNRDPAWNVTLTGMPEGKEFVHYVEKWLASPTSVKCPLSGKAAYGNAVVVDEKAITIPASHFQTFHTPLRTQADFISAYAAARRIAEEVSSNQDIDVFPYSKFYVFFDQYATIVQLTGTLIGAALGLIFLITSLLLGSLATGLIITTIVGMIIVDILGTMAVAQVSLNALTLVNLIICVGISVEFCAHIARAFMFPSKTVMEKAKNKFRGRDARAWTALVNVGGSVFTGITITKFVGVCVLAFTRSKIFEVYYFRIWLALVVWAALHALVLLPVALSLVGGDGELSIAFLVDELTNTGYIDPESDGGLDEDLAARRYRALLPEDDYDSDEY